MAGFRSTHDSLKHQICLIKPQFKTLSQLFLFILLAIALITPSLARAGFLVSIFKASEASATSIDENIGNSQTMSLLQAGDSFSTHSTKDKSKENEIKEDVAVNIVSDNALLAATTPLSTEEAIGGSDFSGETSFYVVRSGDSVSEVADMFGITPDTIWSANELPKGSKLKVGSVLLILPYSGVEYTVGKGDTLQGIANKHKVSLDDILDANEIDAKTKLSVGAKLMIPGASIPTSIKTKSSTNSLAKGSSSIPNVAGYFVNPVPGAVKSRGLKKGHDGVDLAAPIGTNVRAAAPGTVLIARNGWNGGYGNYVVIQHSNGVQTIYGHLSKVGTSAGVSVSQGDIIGEVGSTGKSTGPHLHFETKPRGANPL